MPTTTLDPNLLADFGVDPASALHSTSSSDISALFSGPSQRWPNQQQQQQLLLPSIPQANASPPGGLQGPPGASWAWAAGLTEDTVQDLLLVYEAFIHPLWPLVYLPSLRSARSLEQQSPLLFDAILAVSVANSDFALTAADEELLAQEKNSQHLRGVCQALTESVRSRCLANINAQDYHPTLQAVQALVMIALVDQGAGRTALAYQMSGFACRLVIDLGMHTHFPPDRCPSVQARARDPRERQERARTLWAVFVLDKMLAAGSQRPPGLRLSDIDAPRPSTMERDELDLWLSGGAQVLLQPSVRASMECVKSHALTSFNSWCDIMAILEVILDQVYRPSTRRARMDGQHVDGYEEAVIQIDAELRKWRTSLPPHLQWTDDDLDHDGIASSNQAIGPSEAAGLHILTTRAWYHVCMLLIHRPQVPYLDRPHGSPEVHTGEMGRSWASDTPGSGLGDGDMGPPRSHHSSQNANPHHVPTSDYRLPNGIEASRHAATSICRLVEVFEGTFRVRKFASTWVYLIFQAATVHAGLAAHTPDDTPPQMGGSVSDLSPMRAESARRLQQCIGWLEQLSRQWQSASRHVEILRKLCQVGAETRPPSPQVQVYSYPGHPGPGMSLGTPGSGASTDFSSGQGVIPAPDLDSMSPMEFNAWISLWVGMPIAGDDINLWSQVIGGVTN